MTDTLRVTPRPDESVPPVVVSLCEVEEEMVEG